MPAQRHLTRRSLRLQKVPADPPLDIEPKKKRSTISRYARMEVRSGPPRLPKKRQLLLTETEKELRKTLRRQLDDGTQVYAAAPACRECQRTPHLCIMVLSRLVRSCERCKADGNIHCDAKLSSNVVPQE